MSYLGSPFHKFWSRCDEQCIHPADQTFFAADEEKSAEKQLASNFKTSHRLPGPFDGPIHNARVIVCYANTAYDQKDGDRHELFRRQMTGTASLPSEYFSWYGPRIGRSIGPNIEALQDVVSVFNICPYSSVEMNDKSVRFAAGLPSVWAAQKHLREVLIPKAQRKKIFLVIARKHQLWGVVDGFNSPNIAISRNIGGHLGPSLGKTIREWLDASWKK